MNASPLNIAVLPGDGIGPEVIEPTVQLIDLVMSACGQRNLSYVRIDAGARHYEQSGIALSSEALDTARGCDAILLGAMGLPSIRYDDGTEIAPQLELRETLDLYAGVRPIRSIPGVPSPLADRRASELDFVLIRESTEGLFKSRGACELIGDDTARDRLEITRHASERLFDFAFKLAEERQKTGKQGQVTCVDKANVLGAFAFFRGIFDDVAKRHAGISAEHGYIDAMGLAMVTRPWTFDVLVTENMFGDILSDIGAALMGGMGMAPSADIGDHHAVFQPCHGSAPDIVGQGAANPVATILSGAMMLDWLGTTHRCSQCTAAAMLLNKAVDQAFARGELLPAELGGSSGTREIAAAVARSADAIAEQGLPET